VPADLLVSSRAQPTKPATAGQVSAKLYNSFYRLGARRLTCAGGVPMAFDQPSPLCAHRTALTATDPGLIPSR
jgi:hypothetical protein